MENNRVMIVDDESVYCMMLEDILENENLNIFSFTDPLEAVRELNRINPAMVITDLKMPHMSGIELLEVIKQYDRSIDIIVMSGHGTIEIAVEAMNKGAFYYLTKPFHNEEILKLTEKVFSSQKLKDEVNYLRNELYNKYDFSKIITSDAEMKRLFEMVTFISNKNTSVLILGESGTGKELFARAIHFNSNRKNKKFMAINCGAIPESLVESELFGYVKDSFTGARRDKTGLIESAEGGTVFLDEIGELSPGTQIKLLRFLQEMEITPVGSTIPIKLDVRIITATNKNLENLISKGTFREDLYYRINIFSIKIPPLRDRINDIPLLVDHFIKKHDNEGKIKKIDNSYLNKLMSYDFPGNVRELENIISSSILMEKTEMLTGSSFLKFKIETNIKETGDESFEPDLSFRDAHEIFEKNYILKALKKYDFNIKRTAEQTGIRRNTLYNKLKKYRIHPDDLKM